MIPRTGVAAAKGLVTQLSSAHNRARCWRRLAVAEVSSGRGSGQTQQDDSSTPIEVPARVTVAGAERTSLFPNAPAGDTRAGQTPSPSGNMAWTAEMQKSWGSELQRANNLRGDIGGDEGQSSVGTKKSGPDNGSEGVRSRVGRRRKPEEIWEYDYRGGRRGPKETKEVGGGMLTTYKTIMRAAAQNGTWKTALAVIGHMRDAGRPPNVRTYTMAITSCARGNRWQDAVALLREMEEIGSMPNVVSYGAAIHACANGNKWQLALELLREMPTKGITPNIASWTSTIAALATGREWEQAIRLLREMPAQGVSPNVASYNAAMKACRNAGQWQLAVDLLREMVAAGTTPNAVSYGVAIAACGRSRMWEEAIVLLREMSAVGVNPEVYSYRRDICIGRFSILGVYSDADVVSGEQSLLRHRLRAAKNKHPALHSRSQCLNAATVVLGCWRVRFRLDYCTTHV